MRGVFVNFVALLTRNAVAKRCVFADLYNCYIYNMLYIRLKLAGSSHILKKVMDAQRRTALFFVTQGVGCAPCMCDWGITSLCWIHTVVEVSSSCIERPVAFVSSTRVIIYNRSTGHAKRSMMLMSHAVGL